MDNFCRYFDSGWTTGHWPGNCYSRVKDMKSLHPWFFRKNLGSWKLGKNSRVALGRFSIFLIGSSSSLFIHWWRSRWCFKPFIRKFVNWVRKDSDKIEFIYSSKVSPYFLWNRTYHRKCLFWETQKRNTRFGGNWETKLRFFNFIVLGLLYSWSALRKIINGQPIFYTQIPMAPTRIFLN